MMMDTSVETDGTAFICPECNFNGRSLPELISHLNDAHSEETVVKSEAPPKNVASVAQPEKRSRRKPAFSHQIISQAPRQSSTLFNQHNSSNHESDSNEPWHRLSTLDRSESTFMSAITDDSSISIVSDENTNINMTTKHLSNSIPVAKRNPNVLHSILSQQRPIAPKNGSPTATKVASVTSPLVNPSSPTADHSFYSPTNHSMQAYRKNFQCRMCRLTYKNFHDCTAHIRKKHEISHAQAGRYVEKLDTDAPLPPSATGNYKFRVKGKSLPPQQHQQGISTSTMKRASLTPEFNQIFQCKYCPFTSNWSQEVSKHLRTIHPNYPPHILQQEFCEGDQEINNNHEEDGASELLIDSVGTFGEVIDPAENHNEDYGEEMECHDEELPIDHDADDDEEDALWKYQQEINDVSESDVIAINDDDNDQPQTNYSFAKCFKKFRCPHCEHSAPTLTKLKLHVATHINIKPFMCSICGWRANLRWYIQCHAKKRHSNMNFEVLQLSHEEAEQTINAYMKERGLDTKLHVHQDAKRRFQCSMCQFRSTHPKFLEQHMAANHPNKPFAKIPVNKVLPMNKLNPLTQTNGHAIKLTHLTEHHDDQLYSKFMIKPPTKKSNGDYHDDKNASQALYNRSTLIQADGTVLLPDPSQIVYPNFSTHANFNANRLFYCALCYRGYRWRYDVKRHHKTMHETPEDEAAMGLSMSPKSVKRRNKEFNRNFRYLEYVPQLDGLIPASMSSVSTGNHHHQQFSMKPENGLDDEPLMDNTSDDDDSQDNDLKLSHIDAPTVDITEDEAAALFMIEPQKSDQSSLLVTDHPDESIIVFDDDRSSLNKSSDMSRSFNRSSTGFKPYRCPYCFYRTNWRTDSLRHIRARHKIEPMHDGHYEMTPEEAESTYAEYERTFGFVVAKKVLGRFTEFRHMEWQDLQRSIWEKIKDKQGYEQIIYERLRPDDCTDTPKVTPTMSKQPISTPVFNKSSSLIKPQRMFTCMECAFRSRKLIELEKHICAPIQKSKQQKPHGKLLVSLYQCNACSYRTVYQNYARKHICLHRMKEQNVHSFYYCSFCGYNHRRRTMITVHIAKHHPRQNTTAITASCQYNFHADFSIQQVNLRRSSIACHLPKHKSLKSPVLYCPACPHISTSVLEHDHHRSCHQVNLLNRYKCSRCSFASNSLLYTQQHNLLHSKTSRLLSSHTDAKNLKQLPVSTIIREALGKRRRYRCPFCRTFSSSTSSIVLNHIQNIHTENSSQLDDSLIIGSDTAKEILALGKTVNADQQMDLS